MIRHRRLGPSIASTMAFGLPPNLISMPSTLQMRSIFASAMTEAHLATSPAIRILNCTCRLRHHADDMEALDHSSLS
jgi:hypothetical protein